MPSFGRANPGDSPDKTVNSASWITGVSAAASHYHDNVAGGSSRPSTPDREQANQVRLRNMTEADRLRGEVLQLGAKLLDDVDARKPWFEGNLVAEPISRKLAILLAPVVDGEIGRAVTGGRCVARVNVTSTSHTHAVAAAGETALQSADNGAIEILSPLDTTGEQEVFVSIGAGGGGETVVRGLLFGEIAASGFATYPLWSRGAVVVPECLILEDWSELSNDYWPTWDPAREEEDWELLYHADHRIGAINGTMSTIRGSEVHPVRVWGVKRRASGVGDVLEIIHFDHASLAGFELEPPAALGQLVWRAYGQLGFQIDAGACGSCPGGE